MDDLEITRLCAEAMGWECETYSKGFRVKEGVHTVYVITEGSHQIGLYWPLENDAQAMALVKKFPVSIMPIQMLGQKVRLYRVTAICGDIPVTDDPDLNRAICECVANMQKDSK